MENGPQISRCSTVVALFVAIACGGESEDRLFEDDGRAGSSRSGAASTVQAGLRTRAERQGAGAAAAVLRGVGVLQAREAQIRWNLARHLPARIKPRSV